MTLLVETHHHVDEQSEHEEGDNDANDGDEVWNDVICSMIGVAAFWKAICQGDG